jgi:bacillithiol biosynthesis cysteine-adding enzyme BshC
MEVDCIPFAKTGYFSKLIADYLDEKEELSPFYGEMPVEASFRPQIAARQEQFSKEQRKVLYDALERQYREVEITELTRNNISLLKSGNSFTVVTGHQLNLFTGPLYFLYKIMTVIRLSSALKTAYPDYNFIPVYWMATEDHDFEEINHFYFRGKKLRWNRKSSGGVGRLDTKGLQALLDTFVKEMGSSANAISLKKLFSDAYLGHETLAGATRYLVNALFGNYGLVILDGDDARLKQQLVPFMKRDIFENQSYRAVSESIGALSALDDDYDIQVNPREINYFYLEDGFRDRIESKNGHYYVLNSKKEFSREALDHEMEQHPERFSPNVVTRPLYQELILPNLCYVGGGGELSYWLELRAMFESMAVPFPILMLRNSVLVISKKQARKLERLKISNAELFLKQNNLINKKIREISNIDIDFSKQRAYLKEQFAELYTLASQTDPSFLGAVKAQEVKQLKGLDNLEKRLLKAQKRKLQDQVARLSALQNELFPGQQLQERHQNYSDLYLEYGEDLIPTVLEQLQAYPQDFLVLRY